MMMGVVIGIPSFILVPETYAPVLRERAARRQGLEVKKKNPFEGFVRNYLSRPLLMLLHEPMVCIVQLTPRPFHFPFRLPSHVHTHSLLTFPSTPTKPTN